MKFLIKYKEVGLANGIFKSKCKTVKFSEQIHAIADTFWFTPGGFILNGQNRVDIKVGARVNIVLKADQRTNKLTEGIVAKLLTKSSFHPHGIKVMLEDGQVGRVQEIFK